MVENLRSIVSQLHNSHDVAEWEKVCIPFMYVPEVHYLMTGMLFHDETHVFMKAEHIRK